VIQNLLRPREQVLRVEGPGTIVVFPSLALIPEQKAYDGQDYEYDGEQEEIFHDEILRGQVRKTSGLNIKRCPVPSVTLRVPMHVALAFA
jgi:hypothetical protein